MVRRYAIHLSEAGPSVCRAVPRLCDRTGEPSDGRAACTGLLANEHINSAAPLTVANSHQNVELDVDDYLRHLDTRAPPG